MSTNEQNKTQENNQNGNQKLDELHFLGEKSTKSEESEENSGKKITGEEEKESTVHVTLSENEGTVEKVENDLENICDGVDNKESNQTLLRESENPVLSEDYNLLVNRDLPEHLLEDSVLSDESMSRSTAKSRLPSKNTSRSALPRSNSKLPGELSGQPSVKNSKDDVKVWKNREQDLLSKIADLERKVAEKDSNVTGSATVKVEEKLKNELVTATREKENYKNRLQMIERELFNKEKEMLADPNLKNFKSSEEIISHLKLQNEDLRNALAKMTAILRDKTTICISQEKKIAALTNQVESLKEVIAITKDLLNIRNMEVQHLSNDISAMETKIDCERQRHNQMLIKMDEAVKLNNELKKEYENQLKLFQNLRDSYQEKILFLSRDNADKKDGLALKE